MLDKPQNQTVAEGGTAVQAGGAVTITNVGLSYADARTAAMDVFRANFYELADAAAQIATARAQEFTEDFLGKLNNENPAGFSKANDPDFQFALFTAQREYARSGDKDLEQLLVDLLVDRSKQNQRDMLQIVLNESLNVAPKLTAGQLDALALIFLFKHTQNFTVGTYESLGNYLDQHAAPFIAKASKGYASYQHMEFTSCGAIGITQVNLETALGRVYHGLFQKGFDADEITKRQISIGQDKRFFMACFNDPTKLQIRANNNDLLIQRFDMHGISETDRTQIVQLFETGKMSDAEIREKCIAIRPYMKDLFDLWSGTAMKNFTLTSVGMAIGHANIKRLVGPFGDLSIWIN